MVFVPVSKGFNTPWKQERLENVVRQLFPDEKIVKNSRKESKVVSPSANSYLELDLWIAGRKLAIEYQDPYHYRSHWAPVGNVQHRDISKQRIVEDRGDTLVIVPCWWDGNIESLAATIRAKRPDLLQQYSSSLTSVIPSVPPTNYFQEAGIPDVGSLTAPSNMTVVNMNSANWWITEKFGGIRFCWNWKTRSVYDRYGQHLNYFFAPYVNQLPRCIFEGEIWFGREESKRISGDPLSLSLHAALTEWRLIIFDKPDIHSDPLEQRITFINESIPLDHPFLIIAWHMRCESTEQMREWAQNIYVSSGMGVALRLPNSEYISDNSPHFVEFAEYPTIDALVVDVLQENVTLRLNDGNEFTTKRPEHLSTELYVGDMVKFTCTKKRNLQGMPVDARIMDIISGSEKEEPPKSNIFSETKEPKREKKPFGYWQSGFDGEGEHNAKALLESLAHKKGLDTRDPETWYHISAKEIEEAGGHTLMIRYFTVARLVSEVYPEIAFDRSKFRAKIWSVPANRRTFFEDYAKERGFDPLNPHNWYSLSTKDVISVQGGHSVLGWHGFSVSRSLMELFPEVNFELLNFERARASQWKERENRRAFFENFAKKRNFDPLVAKNWYVVAFNDVIAEKGGASVLRMFRGGLADALADAFGFSIDISEFQIMPKNYWASEENRRKFFATIATKNGLDPLNPEHWYSFPSHQVMSARHGLSVLNHHEKSSTRAILELFPNIGLQSEKFKFLPKGYWGEVENRRTFFERFAKSHNFDPLVASEWYKFTNKDISVVQGGGKVLRSCRSSLSAALGACFPDIGLQASLFRSMVW